MLATTTERKQPESAQEELKEQLHHAWKMEHIGRLAGNVTHDYYNMLSVIIALN